MATRTITVNLLDEHLILEIELEKSVSLKSLVYMLELENHLSKPRKDYFFKNRSGEELNSDLSAQDFPPNIFITSDPEWNQIFTSSIEENEVIKIEDEIVLHENTYWFIPLISKNKWANNGRFHIFNIEGISLINGDELTTSVVIQYHELNETLFRDQSFEEFIQKISQIIGATIKIELSENALSSKNFFKDLNALSSKIIEYANAHLELKWNARIERLSIFNFSHYTNN